MRIARLLLTVTLCLPASAWPDPAKTDDPSLANVSRFETTDGAFLYRAVCQGCHMPDARGALGGARYPALAENPRLSSAQYPAVVVLNGLRGMPPLDDVLNDEQIAAVVNYVRTNFGNDYPTLLTPAEVGALRQ